MGRDKKKSYIFDAEPKGSEVAAGEYDFVFAGLHTVGTGAAAPTTETTEPVESASPLGGPLGGGPTTGTAAPTELRFKLKVP